MCVSIWHIIWGLCSWWLGQKVTNQVNSPANELTHIHLCVWAFMMKYVQEHRIVVTQINVCAMWIVLERDEWVHILFKQFAHLWYIFLRSTFCAFKLRLMFVQILLILLMRWCVDLTIKPFVYANAALIKKSNHTFAGFTWAMWICA